MPVSVTDLPVRRSAASGFTLIEMSLVIAIIGIVFSGLVLGVPQYVYTLKSHETQARMDTVMNALSVYAQRHYRLPCPADTVDVGAVARGTERNGGLCFTNTTDRTLYQATEGVVPWRELGLAERDVMDAWGRYITYKPAPQLTVNTYETAMQGGRDDIDIHNACRIRTWFDNTGMDHVNRQKALFCCNSPPKDNYLTPKPGTSIAQVDIGTWLNNAIAPAAGTPLVGGVLPPASNVESTNRWIDGYRSQDTGGAFYLAGSFATIHDSDADASLLRASGHAVTLISHGGNGFAAALRRQVARMDSSVASIDETDPLNAPEVIAANAYHPQASIGGAHDRAGLLAGASDDLVSFLRSDQIFSKAGDATCVRPASVTGLSTVRTPNVPCSGYGNMMYIIDTSRSMRSWYVRGVTTRLQAVQKALTHRVTINVFDPVTLTMVPKEYSVLSGYIDGEATRDTDPDNVGITYLTTGTLAPEDVLLNYDPVTHTVKKLNDPGVADAALVRGEDIVSGAFADGLTPLFQTIMESAKITGDGTREEPTAIVVLSDGYDNLSGMGATCEPEERGAPCRVSLRTNKSWLVSAMSSRYGMSISADARAMVPDNSISREALFGKIVTENYPHMVVHVIDVAGNDKLKDMTDQIVPDTENPIRSLYRYAGDEASLRELVTGLSGICTRVDDTVAYR